MAFQCRTACWSLGCRALSTVNEAYLLEQFRLMEDYLARGRRLASKPRSEFLADPISIDAAVREITVLFESAHNIAKHPIARKGWRSPQSKAEAFEILAQQSVMPNDLVGAFQAASRFRNLVTYQTSMVQDEIVHQILTQHLQDFEKFLSHVAAWLNRTQS